MPSLRVAFATILGLSLLGPLQAEAQEYALQSGDRIRISILELPVPPAVSTVGIDGRVVLPFLGGFDAVGRTLDELQDEISLAAAGRLISFYSNTGERLQVAIDGTGVLLDIDGYRPIYMTGDVAARGPIEFVPGMTIRTALATAGGASEIPLMFEQAIRQAPDLQSRYEQVATEHADALVGLWGIDSMLTGDAEIPSTGDVGIPPARLQDFVAAEERNVAFREASADRRRSTLERQLALLGDQITRFEERLDNQEEVLRLEEERVAQVESLAERGLAATASLSSARQTLLQLSSSILDAQSSMADLSLRREEIERAIEAFDIELEGDLRTDRSDLVPRIQNLASELNAVQQTLAMNGLVVGSAPQDPRLRFEITRTAGAGQKDLQTDDPDTPLLPGDVVEVRVDYPFAEALGGSQALR